MICLMNNRKKGNRRNVNFSNVQWKSAAIDSDDEQSKYMNDISGSSVFCTDDNDAAANTPVRNVTRPTRVFYGGEETFQSSSYAAGFQSLPFQESKGVRNYKRQHSLPQPSCRGRGNFGNQRRGRPPFQNQTFRNVRPHFRQNSNHLALENDEEDSGSVSSMSNKYDIEYFPNSVNVNKRTHVVNEKGDEKSHSLDFANSRDQLLVFKKFDSMKISRSPDEIITEIKREIEKWFKHYTKNNLDKMRRIETLMQEQKAYSHIFKLHYENLRLQQKSFNDFIESKKHDLNNISDSSTDYIIKKADKIMYQTENECNLFQRKLPAYAYKNVMLNSLRDNQVIIISADCSYFFNTVTPIIVMSNLSNYFVVSCENSNISCEWIKYDVENLIKHQIEDFSEIDFMNAEKILNYLKDAKTSKRNCFILNLPLKRTITSDLLLATVKEVLAKQKESKLVLILSIFDDVKKYQKYFSSLQVFLLKVPKLIFPVQTVWKKDPLVPKSYKEDIIFTALSIHILNKPGDVLAFLSSLAEAKIIHTMLNKKFQELNYDNVECILLHENSRDILDFKKPMSNGKRKFFLATHCVEAIPIPTVLYMIDCGLMRDYVFDNSKNLDVLTNILNSRARARLRKSLVGVYTSGICYRIFSKENFCNDMRSYETPDILTLNPFNALIEIFQHCPEKALSLQFMEPLTDVIKHNTVKKLENFQAIKGGKLTQLGEKIVKLPFNARYSKLILQGIQQGFAYEAVILVAYFSVDSFPFKFTEDQHIIDASKLHLMQHDSDTISFLQVFKRWIDNKCSTAWCDKFYIDCNMLNNVKMKISEICHIVYDSLNENIIQEFSSRHNSTESILEMLFRCFSDNLCVFSGHYRCGYQILSSHNLSAYIHPSSIICNKENLPQLIIYEKIISTSRYFLLGITAIPRNIAEKSLEYEYSYIFEKTLTSETIEPVGERIIKQVLLGVEGKKLQEIENLIKKKVKNDFLVIDPCAEKGYVKVYALKPHLKDAVSMVDQILKSNLNEVINSETVYILELQKGEVVVPLEVKCVKGLLITSVEIKEETQSASSKDFKKFVSEPIKGNTSSSIKCSINLTWVRRAYMCFVSFTPKSFMEAKKLAMKKILVLQTEVWVKVSSRNEFELFLIGLPRETEARDVEEALYRLLSGITITNIEMRFTKPFETTPTDIEEIKMKIEEMCDDCKDLNDFDIIVPKPKNTATIMTAYVNVFGSEDLTAAAEELSCMLINNLKVNAIPVYRSVIRVNYKVFKALESRIENGIKKLKFDLSKSFPERDLFRFEADHIPDTNFVLFKLLSNDMKIMKHLQKIINELLEGEVLSKNKVKDIHKLFCHGGHMWLRTLEKSKKVLILEEYNSKTIRIYGSVYKCFEVKECILNFLEDTENEAVESIMLSNDKTNRMLMKSLIKEYSIHLKKFVELCKLRSAKLDIKSCRLLLHGSRDSIDKAKDVLADLSSKLHSTGGYPVLPDGELCPVCACPAFNLTVRLQHCNHLYCCDCLLNLVEQAQFPIQCCAEDCSQDIVLDDIIKILDEDDAKIKKLLRASLDHYLKSNSSKVFYCPAPDCSMFAYKSEISEKWLCPLCKNEICINCNAVYHYGFTCDMYQGSKQDPDYSFKIWKKGTAQCKECPNCKTAIEKNEGCDHMTCITCKAHFCWVCCREFPSAEHVYNHIPFCDQYPKW